MACENPETGWGPTEWLLAFACVEQSIVCFLCECLSALLVYSFLYLKDLHSHLF